MTFYKQAKIFADQIEYLTAVSKTASVVARMRDDLELQPDDFTHVIFEENTVKAFYTDNQFVEFSLDITHKGLDI